MKRIAVAMSLVLLVCLTGCGVWAPVVPPVGFIYNNTQAPIDTDMQDTAIGTKRGEASTMSILGLVALGDGSIATAAKAGGIKKIQHVDYRYENVLFIYQKYTTIVYGE